MNIQDEVQKIHSKYGMTEKANYEIQLICEKYADEYHKSESQKSAIPIVSGISTDLEKDLFVLINKYAKAGLSKPHTVARLEWVLGSVKKS